MSIELQNYPQAGMYDELLDAHRQPRPAARALFDYLNRLGAPELVARRESVDAAIMAMGITFTVYSDAGNIDRAWPFDIIPRTMAASEWTWIDAGLKQRLTALNLFIDDLYNAQRIVKDKVFPLEVLEGSKNFRAQCRGISPRFGVWAHVCGTDLVRANPRNYMAQPTLSISTAPTLVGDALAPRHLDLRPFVLQADKLYATTGGLMRVALREGSLVVNSSQGGGSKDTWIINTEDD